MKVKVQASKVKMIGKETSLKANIVVMILLLIVSMLLIVFAVLPIDDMLRYENIPEQVEQVEVIGRRTISGGKPGVRMKTYVVEFRLSDGSKKELVVSSNATRIYNAIQKGETGKLTYKEIESNDGDKNFRANRRLISFEKDPQYGGEILKPSNIESSGAMTPIMYFTPWLVVLFILFAIRTKHQIRVKKIPEQVVHVKVVRKREQPYEGKKTNGNTHINYFVTFKISGRLTKHFLVGKNNSMFYDFVNVGDTGTLTYKEQYKKLVYCCFEKDSSILL